MTTRAEQIEAALKEIADGGFMFGEGPIRIAKAALAIPADPAEAEVKRLTAELANMIEVASWRTKEVLVLKAKLASAENVIKEAAMYHSDCLPCEKGKPCGYGRASAAHAKQGESK